MMINKILLFKITIVLIILCFYVEYVHYYVVISMCAWPTLSLATEDRNASDKVVEDPLKFLVITDIHLLGLRKSFWLDIILRDWELNRQFRTVINIFQPEVIFILGDTLDEGLYMKPEVFKAQVRRFKKIFSIPGETRVQIVVGNHDIGFHYEISKEKNDLFSEMFDAPGVRLLTIKGNHFVLLNSMALEGDDCFLCKSARKDLAQIERKLKCPKGTFNGSCSSPMDGDLKAYSEPILVQHFPLYRPSDSDCDDFDAAPYPESVKPLKEAYDCLSKNSTMEILKLIEPRLALSGHTHHGCTRNLSFGNGVEVTISSFNWRNKNNPAFGLGVVTPKYLKFIKCPLPRQSTMIILYGSSIMFIFLWIILGYTRFFRRRKRRTFNYIKL